MARRFITSNRCSASSAVQTLASSRDAYSSGLAHRRRFGGSDLPFQGLTCQIVFELTDQEPAKAPALVAHRPRDVRRQHDVGQASQPGVGCQRLMFSDIENRLKVWPCLQG